MMFTMIIDVLMTILGQQAQPGHPLGQLTLDMEVLLLSSALYNLFLGNQINHHHHRWYPNTNINTILTTLMRYINNQS